MKHDVVWKTCFGRHVMALQLICAASQALQQKRLADYCPVVGWGRNHGVVGCERKHVGQVEDACMTGAYQQALLKL